MSRVADPAFCRAAAGAIVAARGRRSRSRRLLRGAAVSVAALVLGVVALAAPAARASQRPAHPGPATSPVRSGSTGALATVYPYKWSRIAWTGSDEVIAAADSHGDLYYFWQASGSSTWHKQLVAKGGSGVAYSKPSIAWTGHAVVIVAVDAAGDLVYFAQNSGTTTWQSTLLGSGSGGKYQAPAVTVAADGTVLVTAGNTDGFLQALTLAPGAAGWVAQVVATGLFGPSSVTTTPYLGLISATSGGTLYFWWEDLSAPGWNQETLATSSFSSGSVAVSASNVLVTAGATNGAVYFFTQPLGGSGWTVQFVATSGGPYTSPQIAWTGTVNGASYDVITAATKAGTLDYWWVADGSASGWNPETVAANGTEAVYANPGIAITSSSVVITAINTKPGNAMAWYQPFGTNPWHQQVVAKG